jgi:lysophospholipid acyltransferase (LPLAT)-like uncharacterized protein
MDIRFENRHFMEGIRKGGGRYIFAFWHSRFLMMPYGHGSPRITVMSSTHRDSEMLAGILRRFGADLSKGSSTRGGVAGLKTIIRKARKGFDVAFTPDGPKGPRRRVKAGVIAVAKLSGLPILPAAFSAYPAARLKSWDRTLVPKPFSKGVFTCAEPIYVPIETRSADMERYRIELEGVLDRLTDDLDRRTGIGPEAPKEPLG